MAIVWLAHAALKANNTLAAIFAHWHESAGLFCFVFEHTHLNRKCHVQILLATKYLCGGIVLHMQAPLCKIFIPQNFSFLKKLICFYVSSIWQLVTFQYWMVLGSSGFPWHSLHSLVRLIWISHSWPSPLCFYFHLRYFTPRWKTPVWISPPVGCSAVRALIYSADIPRNY